MNRTRLFALLMVACTPSCGDEDTVIIDSRGRIEALINLPVEAVEQSVSVSADGGQSVFFMVHTGVITVDDVDYGVDAESHLIGLGFDARLAVTWVRDFGRADGLRLAGAAHLEPRAILLLAEGELDTETGTLVGPSLLPVAVADGLALPSLPLGNDAGDLIPRTIATRGDTLVLAGSLSRTVDEQGQALPAPRSEAWVRRYEGDLGGTPIWERSFSADGGEATIGTIAIGAAGEPFVSGSASAALSTLSLGSGAFLAKLERSTGAPVWVREVDAAVEGAALASNAAGDLLLAATTLIRDDTEAAEERVFALSESDGQLLYEQTFADAESESVIPRFICAGAADDAYSVVGEFRGTLRSANTVAVAENTAVFIIKNENADGTPLYLRWSESSVDVGVEFGSCGAAGELVLGGRFERQNPAAPDAPASLLYFLRLSS